MYAALWEAYRVEYQMSSGGPGSGLFKSTDGGETWTEITRNTGLPAGVVGRIGVAVSGADSNRVYALVENENGGLFASDDAGATWTLVNANRNIRQRAFYYTHVAADPVNRDTVYLLNVEPLSIGRRRQDAHHARRIPQRSPRPVDRSRRSEASRARQRRRRRGLDRDWPGMDGAGLPDAAVLPRRHDHARAVSRVRRAAGRQHGLRAERRDAWRRRAWRTRAGGGGGGRGAAPALYSPGGAEPGYIAPDPRDPDIFYAGGNNGSFLTRLNRRTGELKEVNPYPRMFSGEPSSALVERWQWTFPIIFSPADPKVLYTSSQHLWKTTNGGQSWDKISADLTRHDPKTMGQSGGPITRDMNAPEVYGTVFAIGPGKKDVNIIWAGSDDGLVHVTRDGGKTWANVTPKDMPDFGRVSQIDASSFEPGARLRRGQAAAARRSRALHLPHARLRQDVDEDRHRHSRRPTTCTWCARIRCAAACSTPARRARCTSPSTTATAGSRCR